MSPEVFACSDWEWVGMYQSAQDVRECLMGAWERRGAGAVCPACGRYAYHAFFLGGGGLPDAFECAYCGCLFGSAEADRMEAKARELHLLYPPLTHERDHVAEAYQRLLRK
jgi:hypothetical protein